MTIKKNTYLLPLVILIFAVAYSCYVVYITDIVFGKKHYVGFVFLFLSVIGTFLRKEVGIYFTGITLLIGMFNLIAFTPAIESYSFGFGINGNGVNFQIQPFCFLLLLVYLVLNFKFLIGMIRKANVNNRATE